MESFLGGSSLFYGNKLSAGFRVYESILQVDLGTFTGGRPLMYHPFRALDGSQKEQ